MAMAHEAPSSPKAHPQEPALPPQIPVRSGSPGLWSFAPPSRRVLPPAPRSRLVPSGSGPCPLAETRGSLHARGFAAAGSGLYPRSQSLRLGEREGVRHLPPELAAQGLHMAPTATVGSHRGPARTAPGSASPEPAPCPRTAVPVPPPGLSDSDLCPQRPTPGLPPSSRKSSPQGPPDPPRTSSLRWFPRSP